MPSDVFCPIDNLSFRFPTNCSFGYRLGGQPLRLLKAVIVVSNDGAEPMVRSERGSIPTLSVLATKACVGRITEVNAFSHSDDFARVARFIEGNSEFPPIVQRTLREAFYQRWKSISIDEHAHLAHAVAIERVLAGQSCKTVAQAHGISRTSALMHQLNMLAVDGPAGMRASAGGCCYTIAEDHGIDPDSFIFNRLQRHAVRGRAGERVRNGESCLRVAEAHGISPLYEAMDMLERVAVNSCAGERVRKGESCQLVAREHGINPMFSAMCELESIAVNTVAGERVRQGESCLVVAREHGIHHCHTAMHRLEMVAVETSGAERVRNE